MNSLFNDIYADIFEKGRKELKKKKYKFCHDYYAKDKDENNVDVLDLEKRTIITQLSVEGAIIVGNNWNEQDWKKNHQSLFDVWRKLRGDFLFKSLNSQTTKEEAIQELLTTIKCLQNS